MKRNFLFLVTAVLFLTAAFASADGVTFSTAYFTLELPDNWETDMGELKKEDNTEELGFFFGLDLDFAAFSAFFAALASLSSLAFAHMASSLFYVFRILTYEPRRQARL